MSTAIILCSRTHSSRVPGKCFIKYQDIPHIEHLIRRLIKSDIPLYLAIPESEINAYMFLMEKYPNKVFISTGFDNNPLGRIHACAKQNNIDTIVRITHDKIFVCDKLLNSLVDEFKR
jgi:spore coat polysaccharide biosynthesis protein SpsF (cytidylyltransferase family)